MFRVPQITISRTASDVSVLLNPRPERTRAERLRPDKSRQSFLDSGIVRPIPQERIVTITRLCLRVLSLVVSIVILALLGHSLHRYHATRHMLHEDEKTHQQTRVWPQSLTLHPTYWMLVAAVVATLFSTFVAVAIVSKAVSISPS
jgi:hypothetical protein